MEESEELKSLLMKVKEESEKADLKLSIQKPKIMASSPITSWQVDGETMETVPEFVFLGSRITVDSDCSHEIKRCLLLGRKALHIRWPKYWCFPISLTMNIQEWFPLGWTGLISLQSRNSPESSPTPQSKSINSSVLSLLYGPTLTSIHHYWKNHSFD